MFAAVNSFIVGGMPPVGQQAYTSAGSFYWTAPAGVTSVCVVCVGGGGGAAAGGSGGGGELRYKNNISVTPGTSYLVNVGIGGGYATSGGPSKFNSTTVIANGGGSATSGSSAGAGGSGGTGDGGGNGGGGAVAGNSYGSGGGAGGYSGDGGAGGNNNNHTAGTGGAGGGGASYLNIPPIPDYLVAFGGGGVGILGEGTSQPKVSTLSNVNGGSSGQNGGSGTDPYGGAYGGGGGAANGTNIYDSAGGLGAVRIIWGAGRAFPSTNTGDL